MVKTFRKQSSISYTLFVEFEINIIFDISEEAIVFEINLTFDISGEAIAFEINLIFDISGEAIAAKYSS